MRSYISSLFTATFNLLAFASVIRSEALLNSFYSPFLDLHMTSNTLAKTLGISVVLISNELVEEEPLVTLSKL